MGRVIVLHEDGTYEEHKSDVQVEPEKEIIGSKIMSRTKYFDIQELVYPEFYKKWGDRAWDWMNKLLISSVHAFKEDLEKHFKAKVPIYINTYKFPKVLGSVYTESGLRAWDTPTGAKNSMHKYGQALDLKFTTITADQAREFLISRIKEGHYPYITFIENRHGWLHFDVRNTPEDAELIIYVP